MAEVAAVRWMEVGAVSGVVVERAQWMQGAGTGKWAGVEVEGCGLVWVGMETTRVL